MKNWKTILRTKAERYAPLLPGSSTWRQSRRLEGMFVHGSVDVRGYANVVLCIEKGLNNIDGFLIDILKLIKNIQKNLSQFNLHLISFEPERPNITHLKKPIQIGPTFGDKKFLRMVSRLQGQHSSVNKAHLTNYSSPTGIKLYRRKYVPTKSDLLIFICSHDNSGGTYIQWEKQLTYLKHNIHWLYANNGSLNLKAKLNDLLNDLEKAYLNSDIKRHCEKENKQWYYSLLIGNMKIGGPLVIGFNWGAAKGEKYSPLEVNKSNFKNEDIGSISRIFPFIKNYYDDDYLSNISQTNYCFFRSENESQITDRDLTLCQPIFDELLNILKPSEIFCLSAKLRNYLISKSLLTSKRSKLITFFRGEKTNNYEAITGYYKENTKLLCLPHPNFPMKKEARASAWEFCCGKEG